MIIEKIDTIAMKKYISLGVGESISTRLKKISICEEKGLVIKQILLTSRKKEEKKPRIRVQQNLDNR